MRGSRLRRSLRKVTYFKENEPAVLPLISHRTVTASPKGEAYRLCRFFHQRFDGFLYAINSAIIFFLLFEYILLKVKAEEDK